MYGPTGGGREHVIDVILDGESRGGGLHAQLLSSGAAALFVCPPDTWHRLARHHRLPPVSARLLPPTADYDDDDDNCIAN